MTATGVGIVSNGLTPTEVASSVLFGRDDELGPVSRSSDLGAVAALERSLLLALRRSPCLIGFSGGRDSSALLAIATRAARREGLPDPVPVTARYPELPETHEDEWQELVIRHLGLSDWIQRRFGEDADLVGPIAGALMDEHGLQYPYNLHLLKPMIDEARGGSFVTGLGGDEAFTPRSRTLAVVTGSVRPVGRDVLRIGAAVAPRRVRKAIFARRPMLAFPWFRPDANRALGMAWLEDWLRLPLRWDARLREWRRSRYVQMAIRGIARISVEPGVQVVHPFADPIFVSSLAREGGLRGYPSRTAAMDALFADVLPRSIRERPTKATFDAVLWSRHSRSFVSELDAGDLDAALRRLRVDAIVDRTALGAHWAAPSPMANSFLLLQACWLALRG